MKRFLTLLLMTFLVGCNATTTPSSATPTSTSNPLATALAATVTPTEPFPTTILSSTSTPVGDAFAQSGITLPAPTCDSVLTPQDTEGPYFKAGSPERNSLIEQGLQGERLTLVGHVLDQNCQPIPDAMLDFWHADAGGNYDNDGYILRGHQFTDEQGRYYLETIMPGLYASRPILHIHVKVRTPNGSEITSQIYFPDQPIEHQTATLDAREGYYVGYFNFIVQN